MLFGGLVSAVTWIFLALSSIACAVIPMEPRERAAFLGVAWGIGILFLVIMFVARQYKTIWLLRHGKPTTGTFMGTKERDSSEGSGQFYAFSYVRENRPRGYVEVPVERIHRSLEDNTEEPMLYDVDEHMDAVPLDHLPGKPEVADDDTFRVRKPMFVHVIAAPLVAIGSTIVALLR